MTPKKSPPLRVAIVGASTLKGREVKSALQDRKFPVKKLMLLDSDEDLGRLSEFDGEPAASTGINYSVRITGDASPGDLRRLIHECEQETAIGNTLQRGTPVRAAAIEVLGGAAAVPT